MITRRQCATNAAACLLLAIVPTSWALAEEIGVMCSGAFAPALRVLGPEFERATGHRLRLEWGPSMGHHPTAIPERLRRGERADVVILARAALRRLAAAGAVRPESQVDLAGSRIAVAVRTGAPVPAIDTVQKLRTAILAAKSIAYSDSASGVYVSRQLFRRLGIEAEAATKARMIEAVPVGLIVARGEAEIGFQQLSELKPIEGITVAGLLPEEVQQVTVFSAALTPMARSPASAELIAFLHSDAARAAVTRAGLDPLPK